MYEQQYAFENDANNIFADNPDQRCPVVFVVDTSGSTHNIIDLINQGLSDMCTHIQNDPLARRRIDLCIIGCGPDAKIIQPMTTVQDIVGGQLPKLYSNGGTPMDEALNIGLDEVERRKAELKAHGITNYRPLIFVLTDGCWVLSEATIKRLHDSENRRGHNLIPFLVGTGGRKETLAQTNPKGLALQFSPENFVEFVEFVSASIITVAQSQPEDEVNTTLPQTINIL